MPLRLRFAVFLLSIPAFSQLATIAETGFKSPIDNRDFEGTIEITASSSMTRGGVSYGRMKRRYCLGVTGSTCDVTTAAGVVSIELVPNDAGTSPTGTYYLVRYEPRKGDAYSETWVVTAATPVKIKDVRTLVPPTPSATVRRVQVDASDVSAGCAQIVGGRITSTGLPCPNVNPTSMDVVSGIATDCATRTVGQHGYTAGGLAALAVDEATGEVLRPSVDTNIDTDRTVQACFATGAAPASWTLMIIGAPGSGSPTFPLISGDETFAAASTGMNSMAQTWFCFDSTGVEFDCLVTINPSTFAARIQHTPFVAGSYAVPYGR